MDFNYKQEHIIQTGRILIVNKNCVVLHHKNGDAPPEPVQNLAPETTHYEEDAPWRATHTPYLVQEATYLGFGWAIPKMALCINVFLSDKHHAAHFKLLANSASESWALATLADAGLVDNQSHKSD